jgi:hypothetical protein
MSNKIIHSEAEVKRAIIDYLRAKKYLFIPISNQGQWNKKVGCYTKFTGTRGAPDLMVYDEVCTNNWVCIELKGTKGRQTKEQKEFEAALQDKGGEYYIVRSINDLQKLGL